MFDPGDFRPICLPYITGARTNPSYVVGGTLNDQKPEPENGYSLSTVGFGSIDTFMLIALIRLYANTPAYHVVVGDVAGKENVNLAIQKLGLHMMSRRSETRLEDRNIGSPRSSLFHSGVASKL